MPDLEGTIYTNCQRTLSNNPKLPNEGTVQETDTVSQD